MGEKGAENKTQKEKERDEKRDDDDVSEGQMRTSLLPFLFPSLLFFLPSFVFSGPDSLLHLFPYTAFPV